MDEYNDGDDGGKADDDEAVTIGRESVAGRDDRGYIEAEEEDEDEEMAVVVVLEEEEEEC
jgi:hypothetical protein